ncbi:MAG: hypothetical protein H0Z24_05720 [Thermosipho sp. (in: Bacteria)]|nr:hypothetical protein [Thermosipho sp. (in: thermotogales)]
MNYNYFYFNSMYYKRDGFKYLKGKDFFSFKEISKEEYDSAYEKWKQEQDWCIVKDFATGEYFLVTREESDRMERSHSDYIRISTIGSYDEIVKEYDKLIEEE